MNLSQRRDVVPHPPEARTYAHDNGLDEDGDPPVASRAVEVIELLDAARCYPCQRNQRACHVKNTLFSCLECSGSSVLECIFVRKVIREARPDFFTFEEIAGSRPGQTRTWREHQEPGSNPGLGPQAQQSQGRHGGPASLPPIHHTSPDMKQAESKWTPALYHTQPPVFSAPMPGAKRQRIDSFEAGDALNDSRQHRLVQLQLSQAPADLVSTRRSDHHLPDLRPSQIPASEFRPRPIDALLPPSQAPLAPERKQPERTALDLKPPAPTGNKRKLEIEAPPTPPSYPLDASTLVQRCTRCDMSFKTPAELKKHFARHEPQYFCDIHGCSRGRDGFTTKNDLDRHKKTMHKIHSPNDRFWKCFYPDCAKMEKVWPRLDNFKAHIVRMHGSQYVNEYTKRAEEWWDNQKVMSLRHSPEITSNSTIAPLSNGTTERLIAPAPPNMLPAIPEPHSVRKRHLSAEGRQEAAQVREMGACLRCSLLKEKCDDSQLCHRCNSYSKKHQHGELVCRRGNLSEFLVPLIPHISLLPLPEEQHSGWQSKNSPHQFRAGTLSSFFEPGFQFALRSSTVFIRSNEFTISLFDCIDKTVDSESDNRGLHGSIIRLREMRDICCLLFDCMLDAISAIDNVASGDVKRDLHDKITRISADIRQWYTTFDNTVFCWKERQLAFENSPWDAWLLFLSICSMLLTERLTASLTTSWAYLQGEHLDAGDDDQAASTLCALLDLKFVRQTSSQYQYIRILLDDTQNEFARDLQQQIRFLDATKHYDTWAQLTERFNEDVNAADSKHTSSDLKKPEMPTQTSNSTDSENRRSVSVDKESNGDRTLQSNSTADVKPLKAGNINEQVEQSEAPDSEVNGEESTVSVEPETSKANGFVVRGSPQLKVSSSEVSPLSS